MGTFNRPMRLESMDSKQSLQLDALVDTGSFFTIVPASLLRKLGTVPTEKVGLELADGRRVAWDIGEARATVDGRTVHDSRGLRRGRRRTRAGGLHARGSPRVGKPLAEDPRTHPLRSGVAPLTQRRCDGRTRELMPAYIRVW